MAATILETEGFKASNSFDPTSGTVINSPCEQDVVFMRQVAWTSLLHISLI